MTFLVGMGDGILPLILNALHFPKAYAVSFKIIKRSSFPSLQIPGLCGLIVERLIWNPSTYIWIFGLDPSVFVDCAL